MTEIDPYTQLDLISVAGSVETDTCGAREVALNELCRPRQWQALSLKNMTGGEYPVYGAGGIVGYHDSFNHEERTVIIGCRGTCGTVAITEPKAFVTSNAMCLDDLDESRVTMEYLALFLRHRGFQDIISGSAQPQITAQGLAKVYVPVPSLDEQRDIVRSIEDAFARIELVEAELLEVSKLAGKLRRATLHLAFGGEETNVD